MANNLLEVLGIPVMMPVLMAVWVTFVLYWEVSSIIDFQLLLLTHRDLTTIGARRENPILHPVLEIQLFDKHQIQILSNIY